MRDHEILLPLANPQSHATHLAVCVNHQAGGINYATYKNEARGIYVSASPIEITSDGCRKFMMFKGKKSLLSEEKRLNRKKVAQLFEQAKRDIESKSGKVWELVDHVLNDNGLALLEEKKAS